MLTNLIVYNVDKYITGRDDLFITWRGHYISLNMDLVVEAEM